VQWLAQLAPAEAHAVEAVLRRQHAGVPRAAYAR
jgi:hypothetical protein